MRVRFTVLIAIIFGAIYIGFQEIAAQNLVTCPGLVQDAIESVGNSCGGLERNSACYGFSSVIATFSQAQPVNFFTRPSDRAGLLELQNLITSPMDEVNNEWGVALLSVQANLPDTLPGQSVIFMLLGDTEIENAVSPEDAFQTGATVNVTLQIGAELYYKARFDSLLVGSIPQGTALTADAISDDGQWVRVVYRGMPGWITRQVLSTDGDLASLPVIGPDTKTSMQAFYFRTSISGTDCTEAPNALVVQGPQSLTVDINANGANIQLGSTIVLYLLPVDAGTLQYLTEQYGELGAFTRLMQIIVLDGHVVLNEGTPDEIVLEEGETTFICLDEPDDLGVDGQSNDREVLSGCPWAPPRPVTVEDIERFRELEGMVLNYEIELPLQLPTVTPTPTNTLRPTVLAPTATPPLIFAATATDEPAQLPPEQPQEQPTQPPPTAAPTATPTATSTPDCSDGFTFPFSVGPNDSGTLIAAINAANDEDCHPGADTIYLTSESNYGFGVAQPGADGLNVLPPITSTITISGSSGIFMYETDARLFYVSGSLTLIGVRLFDGNVGAGNGGAIYNIGSLYLDNVNISNNIASSGGGIYNTGTLNINRSVIANNTGSGIYSASGSVTLLNSAISENSNSGLDIDAGSASLSFTTIYNNAGAGLNGAGGTANVKNSIISDNYTNCFGSVTVTSSGGNWENGTSCPGFSSSTPLVSDAPDYVYPIGSAVDGAVDCLALDGSTVTIDRVGNSRYYLSTCDAGSNEYVD